MMRIAILGWGSLLWEGGADFDKHRRKWEKDGPKLKLEFSRISVTRAGALTLVIDENNGVDTTVAWCRSKRLALDDAVCDLRSREGTNTANIGRVTIASSDSTSQDPITVWARSKLLDAVVWTALPSTLSVGQGADFVSSALAYLKTLTPEGKARAAEYIWRAPDFVRTPLRHAVQREPWFTDP